MTDDLHRIRGDKLPLSALLGKRARFQLSKEGRIEGWTEGILEGRELEEGVILLTLVVTETGKRMHLSQHDYDSIERVDGIFTFPIR